MEKFKAVILEKDGMKHRYLSTIIALPPLLRYQGSDSNIRKNFLITLSASEARNYRLIN